MKPTPQLFTVKNNPFNWRNTRLLSSGLIIACGIALSACGGSSSSSRGGSAPAENKTTVEGTAAKGLLKNARVEICTNTTCSGDENPLAIGSTDINGNYTLPVKVSGNQVLITKVSYQEGAQMVCDVPAGCVDVEVGKVEFGEDVPMPDDLSLRSMVTAEPSSTSVSAHVNPLTELATIAAQKSLQGIGVLTAEAMNNGDAAIRKLFGLGEGASLSSIQPVDVTEDAADGDAALVSLLSAAFASGEGASANLMALTAAIQSGSVDESKLTAIVDAAKAVAEKNNKLVVNESVFNNITDNCSEQGCSVAIEDSELPANAKNELSGNVKAVKAIVADVRNLGWEIYPALEKKIQDEQADPNTFIGRIDAASEIFNDEFGQVATALSEVSSLVAIAIAHKNNLDKEFTIGDNPTLASIAKQVFIDDNQWKVDNWEYNKEYCEEYRSDWCKYYAWSPTQLEGKAANYAAQFAGEITTTSDNKTWKVTDATFTNGEESVSVPSMEVSLPFIANSDKIKSLHATANAKASFGDTTFEVNSMKLDVSLTNDIALITKDDVKIVNPDGIMPYVDTVSLTADASVSYKNDRKFTGSVNIQGGTNANLRNENGLNNKVSDDIFAILPKTVTVKGKFEDITTGSSLEAKLTASLDNYDSYWYHAAGTESDVPVSFTLSKDKQSLTVKIGEDTADNRLSYDIVMVKETWKEYEYDGGDWVCKGTEIVEDGYTWCDGDEEWQVNYKTIDQSASFLRIENCETKGSARCPSIWGEYGHYNYQVGDSETIPGIYTSNEWTETVVEDDWCWDDESGESYVCPYEYEQWFSEPAEFSTLLEMLGSIEEEYYGDWTWSWEYYQLFGQAYIKDESAGRIYLDAGDMNYVDLSKLSSNDSYSVKAVRYDDVLVDTADNFAKATVTAEIKSTKITADLPAMDVKLTAKRSDFNKARADLTLAWTKPSEARRSITVSALAQGRTAEQLEQSLQFLVADHSGTEFTLKLGENKRFAGGKIVKDGTTYATISKEGSAGVYIVTYHYDDQGNKVDSRSEEFESLF